ncbi:MAG: hypothetical protein ACK5TI_01705 [bacterium]
MPPRPTGRASRRSGTGAGTRAGSGGTGPAAMGRAMDGGGPDGQSTHRYCRIQSTGERCSMLQEACVVSLPCASRPALTCATASQVRDG